MERKEFLSLIGFGSASALASVCMGSCSKSTESTTSSGQPNQPTTPTNVNITLDLTQPANASLATLGGYIYTGGIIVAKTMGEFYCRVSGLYPPRYNYTIRRNQSTFLLSKSWSYFFQYWCRYQWACYYCIKAI